MPSWVLFPRFHLAEIEDQPWCPEWIREHVHRALSRMWQTSNTRGGSPAQHAATILLSSLGGAKAASQYTFIDACAGSGGPTPMLEPAINSVLRREGQKEVDFVLTDIRPDLERWEEISKKSQHVSFIREPVDALTSGRLVKDGMKECRLFHLCFHHFDDPEARRVLSSCVRSGDAFIIFEMMHRTIPSLLNTSIVIFSCLITTIFDFWWSPMHLFFTGRTDKEITALLRQQQPKLDLDGWEFRSGEETVLLPFGRMYWYSGVKRTS
ncbi:MAG: hypothetical protein M1820_010864 [Bogoriella megaspora]|nr:MAG: hypothetical protein M1820_010864 [Bogoriella megaspora]